MMRSLLCLCLSLSLFCSCGDPAESIEQADSTPLKSDGERGEITGETTSDSSNPTASIALSTPGMGGVGGLLAISGELIGPCLAYPITDRLLVTTAECIPRCRASEECLVAVMTEGYEPEFFGVTSKFYLAESGSTQVGVIEVSDSQDWASFEIADTIGDELSTLRAPRTLAVTEEAQLELEPAPEVSCEHVGLGLFNSTQALVGLRNECNRFTAITLFTDPLTRAQRGDLSGLIPIDSLPEPEPVEPEINPQTADEERWALERRDAEARAPSCEEGGEDYCDGDVELRCVRGSYVGFHCASVGWSCDEDGQWGAGCLP